MKVAVHQPNYLPWLGYFHKISRVDTFVFLDTVQFERRGYCNRVRVIGPGNDVLWLTQSIQKGPFYDYLIQDVSFSDRHWVKKHLKTLEAAYRKAPHFDEVFRCVERSLQSDIEHLSILNGMLIQDICSALGISTRIVHASQLDIGPVFTSSERIARIVSYLGGTVYLSGSGARAYNDAATYSSYGVELTYNDFAAMPYPQRTQEFKSGLSIIDALFNLGFDGVASFLQLASKNKSL